MRRLLQRMRAVKDLLEAAEQEAVALGLDEPDAEHQLLAALDAPDGVGDGVGLAAGAGP
ncbi:hypothetical protein [Euzebya sp.]|uniref:hypothetical protein n=1 Tax=Euzebya sp. TaxID=1971409 RepID=UPI003510EA3A